MKVKSEMKVLVTQSCPTLCHPMDCSPPGSSVHGILQAKVLEWVAISFSRRSSRPLCRCILIYSITLYVWTYRLFPIFFKCKFCCNKVLCTYIFFLIYIKHLVIRVKRLKIYFHSYNITSTLTTYFVNY